MQETWSLIPGWGRQLEKGMATHSTMPENAMDRGARQATVHGQQRVGQD